MLAAGLGNLNRAHSITVSGSQPRDFSSYNIFRYIWVLLKKKKTQSWLKWLGPLKKRIKDDDDQNRVLKTSGNSALFNNSCSKHLRTHLSPSVLSWFQVRCRHYRRCQHHSLTQDCNKRRQANISTIPGRKYKIKMSQNVKEQGVIRITLVNRRQCICVRKNTVRNKLGNICQNYKKTC